MNIFQFGEDENGELTRARIVEKAYLDGYVVADRFLDSVIFEVTVKDNRPVVKATPMAKDYLNKRLSSIEGWEKRIEEFLVKEKGYDNLFLPTDRTDETWYTEELWLGEAETLKQKGFKIV